MINIDFNKLNPLEKQIHDQLLKYSQVHADIKINKAAEMCDCSVSKISKFVKKLGFSNYKQYMDFLYGKEVFPEHSSSELERLKKFINEFDPSLVDEFIELLNKHEKVLLFGYGPSFICAQYFEYKLRIATNKFVSTVPDEITVETMVDENTLLVVLTTTGTFKSFQNISQLPKRKGCEVLLIAEEYNSSLMSICDRIIWLSRFPQSNELQPHEKSRTVFFIFIEEVIQRLLTTHNKAT
jgi:DNA-binding MurR/RpiR family transcriptional regulator